MSRKITRSRYFCWWCDWKNDNDNNSTQKCGLQQRQQVVVNVRENLLFVEHQVTSKYARNLPRLTRRLLLAPRSIALNPPKGINNPDGWMQLLLPQLRARRSSFALDKHTREANRFCRHSVSVGWRFLLLPQRENPSRNRNKFSAGCPPPGTIDARPSSPPPTHSLTRRFSSASAVGPQSAAHDFLSWRDSAASYSSGGTRRLQWKSAPLQASRFGLPAIKERDSSDSLAPMT